MQFDENAEEGMALIYKRENVSENKYTLKLNGLDPEKTYVLYDYDDPENTFAMTGKDLMEKGKELEIKEAPKAVIIIYKAK